ncbi:kinase-like protein [Amylocystis lapponica]|nr:kinase-like protein [Amylocystis lapponica]
MTSIASSMPDFTGSIIDDGRYELVQLLGAGAYGVVYRAHDLHVQSSSSSPPLDRAIKILHKAGPMKTDTTPQRREISLHRLVSEHPNVVTLHDAFEDNIYYYLVMDFCPGGDLFTQICETGKFVRSDEMIRKIFLQLIDAVHACHLKNVFHRDLKPENILCSADGSTIYLSDFGLATNRKVSYTFGCGSSYYMSPECIGEESSCPSYYTKYGDVWAMGVVLINMVTGMNPWSVAKLEDPCYNDYVTHGDYFIEMLPISEGLNDILRDIFVVDPRDRITLPQLRDAIVSLGTFKKNEKVAKPIPTLVSKAPSVPAEARPRIDIGEENVEEVDLGTVVPASYDSFSNASPHVLFPTHSHARLEVALPAAQRFPIDSEECDLSSTSTSSSGFESAGPITPGVSTLFDPELEIVGVEEVQDLGAVRLAPENSIPAKKNAASPPSAAHRLLERLQMLSVI